MKKAWIENGKVRDICQGIPSECYHPDVAIHYNTDVEDTIENGAELIDGVWTNPVKPEIISTPIIETPVYGKPSPVEFKLLFTLQERLALKPLKESDEIINDWFSILDDQRLTFVDLGLKSTQDALGYLVSLGVLTEERKAQIISNTQI